MTIIFCGYGKIHLRPLNIREEVILSNHSGKQQNAEDILVT